MTTEVSVYPVMGLSPVSPFAYVVVESAGVGVLLGECHSRIKEQGVAKESRDPGI